MEQPGDVVTHWDTGVSVDLLKFIGQKSVTCPDLVSSIFYFTFELIYCIYEKQIAFIEKND